MIARPQTGLAHACKTYSANLANPSLTSKSGLNPFASQLLLTLITDSRQSFLAPRGIDLPSGGTWGTLFVTEKFALSCKRSI